MSHKIITLIRNTMLTLIASSYGCYSVAASTDEFELTFLEGQFNTPKVFRSASGIVKGIYTSTVSVNNTNIGRKKLTITQPEEDADRLCFTDEFLKEINVELTEEAMDIAKIDRGCFELQRLEFSSVEFNLSNQHLDILIPQGHINVNTDELDVDYGINGVRMNYNANASADSEGNQSAFAQVHNKVNVEGWILNSDFSASWADSDIETNLSNLNLTRVLPSIESDLTIGKSYTDGTLIHGFGYGGVNLSRNRQMSQLNTRYVPSITGIANSTSRITIRQHGRIIYAETVSPGPYTIDNFYTAGQGDLEVEIKGENGSVDKKVYPLMLLPSMLSDNYLDYSLTLGARYEGSGIDDLFASDRIFLLTEAQYGLSAFTLDTALLLDEKYQSIGLGSTFYLGRFGSLAVDGGLSFAKYDDGEQLNGATFGARYAYQISEKNSLQLMAYRYQNRDYLSYNVFYPEKTSVAAGKRKARYETLLSRNDENYNLSLTGWQQSYWDDDRKDTGINASVNSTIMQDVSVGLSVGYSESADVEDYYGGVNVSVPIDSAENPHHVTSSVNGGKNADLAVSTTASGSLSERIGYSVSVGDYGVSADASYNHDVAQLNARTSFHNNYSSLSAGIAGTLLWTQASGLNLSRTQSKTVALVEVDAIKDIGIKGVNTNDNGFAVVSLQPYLNNSLSVDVTTIPMNIAIDSSVRNIRPTEGAIVHTVIDSERVYRYLLSVKTAAGEKVDGGDVELDGVYLGTVAPNGTVVVTASSPVSRLSIANGNNQSSCQINLAHVQPNVRKMSGVICE